MRPAPMPKDEASRLAVLRSLEILDTGPEAAFDDLVKLASTICATPISLVSLVDEARQWFKAKVGLDADETRREIAFCAHAILGDELFVVEDAAADERFADNPLVTGEPQVRFYAGFPLRTEDGHGLGTLCVLDREPRTLSEEQLTALKTLGHAVLAQLELRRQVALLDEQRRERGAVERHLDRLFSMSLDMICVAGTDGYFKRINPAFTETLGHSREELLSRPFLEFVHPEDVEATLAEVEKLAHGEKTVWFENRYRTADGSYRWLAWKGSPVPEESLIYAVGRDITDLKLHEEHLAEARDEAVKASRLKSQFLANMSHELRTPLHSVIGFSELLLDRVPGALNEDQEHCVVDILESGRHLLNLINDILDLSKIEAGKLEVVAERFDVNDPIRAAVATLGPLAAKKRLQVLVEIESDLAPAWADAARVRQVLINLLANAVKFTAQDGHVWVRARRSERRRAALEVEVQDDGIGIAAEDLDVIFDEFRQADGSEAREHDGTGLGLSLCRKFLRLMDGRIWVQSAPGHGSTFTFSLPAAR